MNKKQKEETVKVFADAFHEVVVPVLEDMDSKIDKRFDSVEKRLFNIENKLDKMDKHFERHDNKLDNHEKRIKKLEVGFIS